MEELARFCCPNTACADYGKRNAGNLTVCDRFGKQEPIRLLYCRTCKKRFSERKGTPWLLRNCPARNWFPCWGMLPKVAACVRPAAGRRGIGIR